MKVTHKQEQTNNPIALFPELDNMRLVSLTINTFGKYDTIEITTDDIEKPFAIITTQKGVDLSRIGELFAYLSSGLNEKPDFNDELCIVNMHFINDVTRNKIRYEIRFSDDKVESEFLSIDDVMVYNELNLSVGEPLMFNFILTKFVYITLYHLEDMIVELEDDVKLLCKDNNVLDIINEMLVNRIGFLSKPLTLDSYSGELVFYDDSLDRYTQLSNANRSIRSVVYVMFAGFFAALDGRILVIDDFIGMSIQSKLICIALFTMFSSRTDHFTNGGATLIIIDSDEFQGYVENTITNSQLHLAYALDDTNYVTKKKLIDNRGDNL